MEHATQNSIETEPRFGQKIGRKSLYKKAYVQLNARHCMFFVVLGNVTMILSIIFEGSRSVWTNRLELPPAVAVNHAFSF